MSFNQKLTQGRYFELELLKHIKYSTYETAQDKGNFKDWDIRTIDEADKATTYEVKSESKAYHTGNICIEFEYNGLPSGIDATKADIWGHYIVKAPYQLNNYKLILIPVSKLKEYIELKQYKFICNGGDYNRSKLYIFPINFFKEYIVADNISKTISI